MRHGAEGATEKGLEMDVKADIAAEAVRIVTGARRSAYGTPERNFERIARLWNAHLCNRFHDLPENVRFVPGDVAALMRLMKEARLAETPDHRDSFVDLVGYSLCGAEVAGVPVEPLVKSKKTSAEIAEARAKVAAACDRVASVYDRVAAKLQAEMAPAVDAAMADFATGGLGAVLVSTDPDGAPKATHVNLRPLGTNEDTAGLEDGA